MSKIKIGSGVRQRCFLSPLLFNIMIKMLALIVCQSQEIEGLLTGPLEHKILFYSDDAMFVLQHPETSLKA